jgi:predicted nucleic acid-binding protein
MALALLDTTVLVYTAHPGLSFHAEAARLLDRGLRKSGLYCIAPQHLVEFSAVVTRPRFV